MASIYERKPFFKAQKSWTKKTPRVMSTSCRAICLTTNKRPKSIRIRANSASSLRSTKRSMTSSVEQRRLTWTIKSPSRSSKRTPGSVPHQLETGAARALSRTCRCGDGSAGAQLLRSSKIWMSDWSFCDQNAQQKCASVSPVYLLGFRRHSCVP